MGRGSFGSKCGHPIVTNADFVSLLFSAVRSGDTALPNYFGISRYVPVILLIVLL